MTFFTSLFPILCCFCIKSAVQQPLLGGFNEYFAPKLEKKEAFESTRAIWKYILVRMQANPDIDLGLHTDSVAKLPPSVALLLQDAC